MESPKQIGRYEILAELGQGAMGTVYRAKDPAMDREVAIKTIISVVLASDKGGEFRERFYREARASGKLAHPGIVAVFDVGEHEGVPYLVMEFVSGRTLADAAKHGERFTLDRICEIGQQIAEALGHAHHAGVIHRDIKPANILLTSREVYGVERPKITDFGIAKLAAGHTTMTGQILGTPAFMAPEQFTGSPIDARADLFSLGVVLYWLATGEQPFPGEGITAVSYKVVHTEPVPPRKLNPSMPARFEAIVMKCLAKSPEERYQTGEELARDLAELRASSASGALRAAASQAPPTGADADATLVETPAALHTGAVASTMEEPPAVSSRPVGATQGTNAGAPQGQSAKAAKAKSSSNLALLGVAAAVILVIGFVALRHRSAPAIEHTAAPAAAADAAPSSSVQPGSAAPALASDSASSVASAPETATPAVANAPGNASPGSPLPAPVAKKVAATSKLAANTKPTIAAAKSAPDVAKNADTKSVAAVVTPPPAATPAAPAPAPAPAAPAPVGFDPKSLDPKQNAKLKIEAEQWPAGLDFIVEMNGKVYLRRSVAGEQKDYENLFVPPGVQEFTVTASSNGVMKTSNIVSTEFKAKKKNTLKIEFRSQGQAPGTVPQGLYPNTEIVVTLK